MQPFPAAACHTNSCGAEACRAAACGTNASSSAAGTRAPTGTGLAATAHAALPDTPVPPGVQVVHADESMIVAVKPAGLLAVPGRGTDRQDCLAARVRARFADALVVHRLDMATSGLMIFARGADAQRRLGQSFAEREVAKRYIAVVIGRPADDAGEIDLPLSADWPNRPRQQIDRAGGRPSLTRYRLSTEQTAENDALGRSRLVLEPVTGRTHQLRVHLLAIGHPILGDALYAPADVVAMADRLMLHAERLALTHPATGRPVAFESPSPF